MKKSNCQITDAPYRIDVHHHIIPNEYISALDSINARNSIGFDLPKWTPEMSLDIMDQNNIRTAVLSLSTPGVFFGDANFAQNLARQCNEICTRIVNDHPERFGFFAALPMPVTDAATSEAIYALDTLKADGVGLLASSGGRFLGDPQFDELMDELNKRKAVVAVHPNIHPTSRELQLDIPFSTIEFVFDTTRAVANLMLTGTLERYPDIRWIIAHAGGTIPYIAMRINRSANFYPSYKEKIPHGALTYLKRLYYDTAYSCSPYAIRSLMELVEPSHILFGSDFPFLPGPTVTEEVQDHSKLGLFDQTTLRMVEEKNAFALFLRLNTMCKNEN